MKTNIFKNAALAAVILAGMGFSGFKAYDYSYGKSVNSEDNMLILNIEALSDDETPKYDTKDEQNITIYASILGINKKVVIYVCDGVGILECP